MTLTQQLVVRRRDGSYIVRTYEALGDFWVPVSDVPANHRDIAQASMADRVFDE